jgi:uncharacterized membrane protein
MAAELEYYKEQLEHGRHIEVQRSTVAVLAATISGAIIGELLKKPLTPERLPYTVTLFFLGLVAWLLSAKLYERFRLHNEIAKLARDVLDPSLKNLRRDAEKTIKAKYPFLFRVRLHIIWNALFGCVCALGFVTTLIILCGC